MKLAVARSTKALRCKYCGGPLPAGPDAVAVVCPSCGRVNWLRGREEPLYVIQSLPLADVEQGFQDFVSQDPDLQKLDVESLRVEVTYIPFYEVRGRGRAEYRYEGYVTRTRTVRQGGELKTVTENLPFSLSGVFVKTFRGLILAKRVLGEEAADELAEAYLDSHVEPMELEKLRLEHRVSVLSADIEQGEALNILREAGCDWLKARLEEYVVSETSRAYMGTVTVTSRSIACHIDLDSIRLVLIPLAKVFYTVEGKIYRAYFAGWDMKPLLREEPMTGLSRSIFAGLAGLVSAAVGAAGVALGSIESIVLGLIGGAGIGLLVSKAALRPVRLEKGRAKSWIKSIPETVAGG